MICSTELFLHVVDVIGAFVGCATLLLGTVMLQRATRVEQVRAIAAPLVAGRRVGLEHISIIDVIIAVSVLLIAVTGLDMARTTGYLRSGWVGVAIATFLLLGPVVPLVIDPRLQRIARAADGMPDGPLTDGLRALVRDRVLTLALQVLMSVLVSLVFLMTYKPSLVGAVIAVLTAIAAGVLWSLSPQVQTLARALIGSGRRRGNDSP